MKNWIWNEIGMQLPDDWEMLQFSRNPAQGRIVFADRYQFRFELDWMKVEAPPDMKRMADDYRAKLEADGLKSVRKTAHSPWLGASGIEGERAINRYGAFFPEKSLVIESVFIWAPGEHSSASFEGRILDGIRIEPRTERQVLKWRAFGMQWNVDYSMSFDSCEVAPGLARALFINERKRARQEFVRRGLVREWLNESVETWLERQVPDGYALMSKEHSERFGHEVFTLVCRRKIPVFWDWIYGTRTVVMKAWICPKDGRLYSSLSLSHPKLQSNGGLLVCCSEMEGMQ